MNSLRRLFVLILVCTPLLAADDPTVKLNPFRVQGDRASSYPFGLKVRIDRESKRIVQLVIDTVRPNSEAEKMGLQPGDEIVRLNGRPVSDFPLDLSPDSDLNRLLLQRAPGDPLKMEVITRRTIEVVVHATAPSPVP